MLTQHQTDITRHLLALAAGAPLGEGLAVPVVVEPYAGQLLRLDALGYHLPALWVDVEAAASEAVTEGGDVYESEITAELVLATLNQASPGAQYSDGLALAAWATQALMAAPIPLAGGEARPVGAIRFRRIATDHTYWAGRVSATLRLPA